MYQNKQDRQQNQYDWQQKQYEWSKNQYNKPKQPYGLLPYAHEIDGYLNQLTQFMEGITPTEKSEIHQEIRQHIESMALAEEELGASRTEAVARAMARFGEAKRLGKQLAKERRALRINAHMRMACWTLCLTYLWVVQIFALVMRLYHIMHLDQSGIFLACLIGVVAIGLLTGVAIERDRPGRAVDASMMLGGISTLYMGALWGIHALLSNTALPEFFSDILSFYTGENFLLTFVLFSLSGVAAYLTGVRRVGYWYRYPLARMKRLPRIYAQYWVTNNFAELFSAYKIRGKESGFAELAPMD